MSLLLSNICIHIFIIYIYINPIIIFATHESLIEGSICLSQITNSLPSLLVLYKDKMYDGNGAEIRCLGLHYIYVYTMRFDCIGIIVQFQLV